MMFVQFWLWSDGGAVVIQTFQIIPNNNPIIPLKIYYSYSSVLMLYLIY